MDDIPIGGKSGHDANYASPLSGLTAPAFAQHIGKDFGEVRGIGLSWVNRLLKPKQKFVKWR